MNNALIVRDEMPLDELARVLANSGFFVDAQDANKAIVKVLAGRELGFGPIASMTGIYIIKGKPTLSANLMAAAVKRHPIYNYRVIKHSDEMCEIAFFENGEEVGRSVFTSQDAQKAGTQNMAKFPRNMLFARALSNGVRWHCPDVTSGASVYTPDELGAEVDDKGDIIPGSYEVIQPHTVPAYTHPAAGIIGAGLTENEHSYRNTIKKFTGLDATDEGAIVARFTAYRAARTAGADTDTAAQIADAKCWPLKDGRLLGDIPPEEYNGMVERIDSAEEKHGTLSERLKKTRAHILVLAAGQEQPAPFTRDELIKQWGTLKERAHELEITQFPAVTPDAGTDKLAAAIDCLSPLVAEAEWEKTA